MNWDADYVFTLDTKRDSGEMLGLVPIDHQSGATYWNVRLKLIIGEVHTVQPERWPVPHQALKERPVTPSPFAEKHFFEYHLYALQRLTTIRDWNQKQIELFHVSRVRGEKPYILRDRSRYDHHHLSELQTQRIEVPFVLQTQRRKDWSCRSLLESCAFKRGIPMIRVISSSRFT